MQCFIKHKNTIVAAFVIIAALIAAWVFGGNYNRRGNDADYISAMPLKPGMVDSADIGSVNTDSEVDMPEQTDMSAEADAGSSISGDNIPKTAELPGSSDSNISGATKSPDSSDTTTGSGSSPGESPKLSDPTGNSSPESPELSDPAGNSSPESPKSSDPVGNSSPETPKLSDPAGNSSPETPKTPAETIATAKPPAPETSIPASDTSSVASSGSGKDKYNTDPIPEGKPMPVEPEDLKVGDGSFKVTLTVRCDNILKNMDLLDSDKHELVPDNGVILPATTVTAYDGESVFNVFQREMRRARIHMVFRSTPIYNSAYIEAINNLYEFDAGELSGWMYCVNGWYPNYGCSRYRLNPGDVIEWRYTCDLGRDLGQEWIKDWQQDD